MIQDFGTHHLYIFRISDPSHIIWRTVGEKYWSGFINADVVIV